MIYIEFIFLLFVVFVIFHFKLWIHLFPSRRLPVLMYHNVVPHTRDNLDVTIEAFENQLKYLKEKGFQTYFFSDLKETPKIHTKSIILTFDDGFKNNLEYALPLLKKYGIKATIFLNTETIEKQKKDILTPVELKQMYDSKLIEYGLHSHSHLSCKSHSISEINQDLEKNIHLLNLWGVVFSPVFAYPYGARPKEKQAFYKLLKNKKIDYALRIGNKLNTFPFKNPYEICRIHVKDTDTLQKFKLRLIFGKLKFF
ncbi:polysaccharide deacetylase family protein [Ornithobacterium rhinotracheale]|uniref:polysaccharide deacetylase family protein n=1 Tax=Ornithobacterium rhinotracheale TaxID=28251 RepID=UPI00129C8CBD|nr:polysaccharide deacetylase family protein [Ornithobacterium rhinotracheale]MRJ07400.1 polysaccharide deacetylase family protein [Ornithobacterium rhinotracheale]UOH77997.1 polysaccharide deacetylase family protein [Ornithobacterium rhinotracheale]